MYKRQTHHFVQSALESQAAVVLLGPRQVGKTTLALDIASEQPSVYLDLERDADRQILTEPDLYLDEQAGKLVILDEVQQMPGLFKSLPVFERASSCSWDQPPTSYSNSRQNPLLDVSGISKCPLYSLPRWGLIS